MKKKKADKKSPKEDIDIKKESTVESSSKVETPEKSANEIVITETEDDVVLSSGFNGDPEEMKEEIKKEAAKSDILSRFLIPLFTFIIIGLVAAGLTWYYARPTVTQQKPKEEKIETPPVVNEENAEQTTQTPAPATPAPATTTPAPAPTTQSYVVKEGDTLSSIATAHGMKIATLAAANAIADPNSYVLHIGQTLKIPSGQ